MPLSTRRSFEHQYYRLPFGGSPETILDLGANIGLTTIYLARAFPQAALACVEPFAKNLRVLERNLQLNKIHATIFPAAVHIDDGCVRMETALTNYNRTKNCYRSRHESWNRVLRLVQSAYLR